MAYKQRPVLEHVRCPECGVGMKERVGKHGQFFGCSRFPICIGTRPKGDESADSYTTLLRVAYVNALRTLSGPRFMSGRIATAWMIAQAYGRALTEEEWEAVTPQTMANEHLERAIDAAGDYASEKTGELVDFLVNAHEERYAAIRAKLKFMTTARQIREMPKASIIRRYDTSDLNQFEAHLAQDWKEDGIECPRCDSWCEPKPNADTLYMDEVAISLPELDLTDKTLQSLFDMDIKPLLVTKHFDCGRCGPFARITKNENKQTETRFEYENDKNNPSMVKGIGFKTKTDRKDERR